MSLFASSFALQWGLRKVVVYRDQCPHYSVSHPSPPLAVGLPASLSTPLPQDLITLAQSIFPSLQETDDKDIVVVGKGAYCPWDGNAELSERAWGDYGHKVTEVTISLKHGMYPLDSEGGSH
jgi:hypothetical protein